VPAAPFTEIVVETAPGLSGLAADPSGALWTVAERDHVVYRIALDPLDTVAFPIDGAPPDHDLEAIAALPGGRFAFGAEGRFEDTARVLVGERRGDRIAITHGISLSSEQVGVTLAVNHGAEGVCAAGDTLLVAIETVGVTGGRRWAPLVRLDHERMTRVYRVWLTTPTGKLSAIDCRAAAAGAPGAIDVLAVERHFEVSELLVFQVGDPADIAPRVALDLSPVLRGRLNLEGIASLPDGRVVATVDNQYRGIRGPSELLVFPVGVVR
jgi:hypothetical protein